MRGKCRFYVCANKMGVSLFIFAPWLHSCLLSLPSDGFLNREGCSNEYGILAKGKESRADGDREEEEAFIYPLTISDRSN